jgi:hypothetical protein
LIIDHSKMKTQLLIFLVVLIATVMGGLNRMKRHAGRTTSPETVDFQLIYLGSCDQFYSIPRVAISSLVSGCLPINDTQPFLENDDLTADVLCTNIGPGRAQIDFVEIYEVNDTTPFTGGFAISFVPNAPFRAINHGVNYLRRPTCSIDKDFCSATNYVHSCEENAPVMRKGFVISNDLIFITRPGFSAVGCATAINSCCTYLPAGFCPFTAPNDLLEFRAPHYYDQQQQQHQSQPSQQQYQPAPVQQQYQPAPQQQTYDEDEPAPQQQYQPAPPQQQYQPAPQQHNAAQNGQTHQIPNPPAPIQQEDDYDEEDTRK